MAFVDLIAKIGLDIEGFTRGVESVQHDTEKLADNFEHLTGSLEGLQRNLEVAFTTGAVLELGKVVAEAGEQIEQAMITIERRTGIADEALASMGESFKNVFAKIPEGAGQIAEAMAL